MSSHVLQRRTILAAALVLAVGLGAGAFAWRASRRASESVENLLAAATDAIEQKDVPRARILLEKAIQKDPDHARAHYLRATILLDGADPATVTMSDKDAFAGIRELVQATKLQPDLIAAQKPLLAYFLAAGDMGETRTRAAIILRAEPQDRDARRAATVGALDQSRTQEAITHLNALLAAEKPTRPRTVRLLTRISDLTPRDADRREQALALSMDATRAPATTDVDDRLALIELHGWRASRETDRRRASEELDLGLERCAVIVKETPSDRLPARRLLEALNTLLPNEQNSPFAAELVKSHRSRIDKAADEIFATAIAARTLDPTIHVSLATRLLERGKTADAIKVVENAIALAKEVSPETRKQFSLCDLWLAERFLADRRPDLARPYVENLLADDSLRGWGQLLTGQEMVDAGNFDAALEALREAVHRLPNHGTANALYGLCLLRRGFVSEGRQRLQKGISMGAVAPPYKAWLAVALSEAGFQDQAVTLAREIIADRQTRTLGRALLAKLRIRSGQLGDAESDLREALAGVDEKDRPGLELSLAEVLFARGKSAEASKVVERLKVTPLAASACMLEYRDLIAKGDEAAAKALLDETRRQHPNDLSLAILETRRRLEKGDAAGALALLEEQRAKHPDDPTPSVLAAEIHDKNKDGAGAIAVLRKASNDRPSDVSLRIRLAERLLSEKNFDEADAVIASMRNQSQVNPSTIEYLSARLASLKGDWTGAEEILRKASAKDPDNPTIRFLLGQSAARRGDHESARALFEQCLAHGAYPDHVVRALFESLIALSDTAKARELLKESDSRNIDVRALRGQLVRFLARKEKWNEVEEEIGRLLSRPTTDADWALAVATLRHAGVAEKARQTLDEGMKRYAKSAALGMQQAEVLIDEKKYDAAAATLDGLLATHPKDGAVHLAKAQLLVSQERQADALQAAMKGWAAAPGDRALEAIVVQLHLRLNQPDKALAFAEAARRDHPDLPNSKYLVARMRESLGQSAQAADLLRQALAEDPNDTAIANHYVRLMVSRNQTEGLEKSVEKLLAANPDNQELLGVLIEVYAGKNEIDKANSLLARVESKSPNSPVGSYLRAVLALARRDYAAAESTLKVALADPRGHVPSTLLLARMRIEQNRPADALALIGQVRRLRPTLEMAQALYARLLFDLGRLDEAEDAARAYLGTNPDSRATQLVLARVLGKRGATARFPEAVKLIDAVLSSGALGPADFQLCVETLYAVGAKERAWTVVRERLTNATDPAMVLAGGRGCLNGSDAAHAREVADALLARDPSDSWARVLLGDVLAALASDSTDAPMLDRAVAEYRLALKSKPDNIVAANNLAWTLGVRLKKPHRALEELTAVLPAARSPSPTLPAELLDTIGVIKLEMGNGADAQRFLEVAAARAPSNPAVQFHLGQAYQKMNRQTQARQCFERATSLDPGGEWARRVKNEAPRAN